MDGGRFSDQQLRDEERFIQLTSEYFIKRIPIPAAYSVIKLIGSQCRRVSQEYLEMLGGFAKPLLHFFHT